MYFHVLKMDTKQYSNRYLRLSLYSFTYRKAILYPSRIEGRAIVIFSLDLVKQQKMNVCVIKLSNV